MNLSGRVAALLSLGALAAIVGAVVFTGGTDEPGDAEAAGAVVEPLPDAVITAPTTTIAPPELPDGGLHPPLRDIDGWLQSDVTSLEELRGQVVAVQFWTFGCSNCRATLGHMSDWYAEYRDDGLEVVGIHAPELSYEAEVDNIVDAASDLGVTWPIALDTQKHTFHDWQEGPRGYWPRVYLLDRDGHVRYDHRGEGGYAQTEAAIRALLAEPAS